MTQLKHKKLICGESERTQQPSWSRFPENAQLCLFKHDEVLQTLFSFSCSQGENLQRHARPGIGTTNIFSQLQSLCESENILKMALCSESLFKDVSRVNISRDSCGFANRSWQGSFDGTPQQSEIHLTWSNQDCAPSQQTPAVASGFRNSGTMMHIPINLEQTPQPLLRCHWSLPRPAPATMSQAIAKQVMSV